MQTKRLTAGDRELAQRMFVMMAEVFEEPCEPLDDAYVERLLSRPDFWAIAALVDGELAGGITAHTLPLTRVQASEVFIYDVAVRADLQRRGVGRALIAALREAARAEGVRDVFVPAADEDTHALDFYRALGGAPSPVTFFTFSPDE